MNTNAIQWRNGLKDGIPICLGYFAVSFTFGIMASGAGLSPWQAVIMSFTNLTSAGQFAALGIIAAKAPFMEMAVAQFVLLSFPEAGRKDAIFSPLPDRIRCYR